MTTACRMYRPEDIDALVTFWKENAGWDDIDRTEWERRFYKTPYGCAAVVLAEEAETRELIGQFLFIPTRIHIDGRYVKGFRPFAPVVKERVRSELGVMTLMEVVMKMYTYALAQFKGEGIGLIHMLPDPRWSKAFQFLPDVQMAHFPLWSLPLPLSTAVALADGYRVHQLSPEDDRIDVLWEKSKQSYGCSFPRNTTTLPWKTSHGNYQLIGVFQNEELIGLSASVVKARDRQWLICDLLAANDNEAADATLVATCLEAQRFFETSTESNLTKIAILATPLLQKKLASLGFEMDHYKFSMVVQVLDEGISKEQAAPERWYVSAND